MTEFLDFEPDEPASPPQQEFALAPTQAADVVEPTVLPVESIMPMDFDIQALLTFLPDVRLKRELDALGAEARALAVPGGDLTAADALRPRITAKAAEIMESFDYPCKLSNMLHKRLTGLRADFLQGGEAALGSLDRWMYAEKKRLDAVADQARREAQAAADRQAKEDAKRAAEQAARQQAPAPIVEALKEQARTATAPPVATPAPAPALANTATVPKWRARLRGADPAREPNPDVVVMTAHEQEQVLALLDAIRDGRAPLAGIAVDWSYWNARAAKEKTTLDVPGIEAFDAGSTRSKPKGRSR